MYALLTSQSGLPVVKSTKSIDYVHLIMAGYEEQATGHKSDMLDKEKELLEEMYGTSQRD